MGCSYLLALAVANGAGAGLVGRHDSEGDGGDCMSISSNPLSNLVSGNSQASTVAMVNFMIKDRKW